MDEIVPGNEVVEPRAGVGLFGSAVSRWVPRQLGFGPYRQHSLPNESFRRPLVVRLTKDIAETYNSCNPQFQYSEELNPKRFLTSPSVGVLNDGHDNAKSDLILMVNLELINQDTQRRYIVKDVLGQGTFGQVAKCWVPEMNSYAAVKIIKNQPAYYQQALVEVSILTALNMKYDPEDKHHIVRIYDHFVFQRHLCISFEMLDTNLYELIKLNQFRGFSLSIVQLFTKQILGGLALLKEAGIIHCDLKPENILLCTSMKPAGVKIIDFGSACMEDRTVYSYIQSRYYRSPEVLLGYQYTTAIDMWSFGCIVAELFLGLPLFPGASEFDLLKRMIEILGGQPPDYILKEAKNTSKFFKCVRSVHTFENAEFSQGSKSAYQVLTLEEYEAREMKKPAIGKEYFGHKDLETLVTNYPYKKTLTEEDILKESRIRLALIDFLRGLVDFDPAKRWSPLQASRHPFVTGEPFNFPFKPPPETPRMPVTQNFRVDHHPGGGHWFAAGLSPNIPGRRYSLHNSPQFQMLPYANATSYGSIGSHGSYNDNYGLGSSYGSYGDSGAFTYFSPAGPSGINIRMQGNASFLGSSPDARRRIMQYHHGNGLGMSPSAGNLAPLPLGTSPSQFTPPGSYGQFPVGSPGHYGPTSPARSSCHGSPLGKVPAGSQNSRRKSWGYGGSSRSLESSSLHWQGQCLEGTSPRQRDGNYQAHSGSPSTSQSSSGVLGWKPPQGGSGIPLGPSANQTMLGSLTLGSNSPFSRATGAAHDKSDASTSLPDPGDWDPNYSDDQLLQDECSDMSPLSTELSKGMHLGPADSSNSRRYSNNPSTNSSLAIPRSNGPHVQGYSDVDVGSPSAHDPQTTYVRSMSKPSHFMPHMHQNSPSRFGQQPIQRSYHGRSQSLRGSDWSHMKVQPPSPSFNSGGPHSPGNTSFHNGMPWGRKADHPITSIPPTSHGR